jgi:adenine deaminase
MGEEEGWAKRNGAARKRTQNRALVFMANMVDRWREESIAGGVCTYIGVIVSVRNLEERDQVALICTKKREFR